MGSSTPFDGPVSASCKSCLCSLSCEEKCVKHEKCSFHDIESSLKGNPLEDLEISSSSEESDSDDLVVQKLGIILSDTLHVHDNLEPLCVKNLISDQDENCILDISKQQDGSSKHATVLFSNVQPSTLDALEELSRDTVCNDISIDETPTSACLLPVNKPVSAMKGSREKQGKYLSTKLSVKWAPEVYDPPVTSSSHTVKGHHRHNRHKTKKDRNIDKYAKGKSSRGSGSEKKHDHCRSTNTNLKEPQTSRLLQPSVSSNKQVINSPGQPEIKLQDYSVRRGPESDIFASSCHVELLTPVPLPVAKAS